VLIERMQRWMKTLLMTSNARDLPHTIADHIQHSFLVPQVAIKVWGVSEAFQIEPFAQSVIDPIKDFAASLTTPYVGMNQDFDAVQWLPDPAAAQSVAFIALRATRPEDTPQTAAEQPVIGLLVLASPDPQRYFEGMGTTLIERMGDMDLVARYLDHVRYEKRLAERTVTLYTLDLEKLADYAAQANVALEAVQSTHIRRWVAQMHSGGRSGRGIALILSGWRGFYVWLGRQGLVSSNPVQDVRAPKAPKPLPKALSVDDAVQLAEYHAAPDTTDPWLECRDSALVELLYGCGLRVGEVVGLDVQAGGQAKGWIDFEGGEAHVLGKGSKRRSVPVGGKALEALQAWLGVRSQGLTPATEDQTAMFIGRNGTRLTAQAMWQRLRQRSLKAGLSTPVHPHMLRHSFASHVLQSSQDLRGVQELLGHANITTTQVYTRLDFQHLAQAYDSAHPRARKK
jgi:integrase/recombinase XerC